MFKFRMRGLLAALTIAAALAVGWSSAPAMADDAPAPATTAAPATQAEGWQKVFSGFPKFFVYSGIGLEGAKDLGLTPDISFAYNGSFPSVAKLFLGDGAFGTELTTLANQCRDKPCKTVFLTVHKPDLRIYANRQSIEKSPPDDPECLANIKAREQWEDKGKVGPQPEPCRSKLLFAGKYVAASSKCFTDPATIPMLMFGFASSPKMPDDYMGPIDSPVFLCTNDPSTITPDEIGFTSGVGPHDRILRVLDGTLYAALVAAPDDAVVEGLPLDQRRQLVEVMSIDDMPEFPGDGITIRKSSENDPVVMGQVKELECGVLRYYDWAKNNHADAVRRLQHLVQFNDADSLPEQAEIMYQDMAKIANFDGTFDGTMSKALTDRADLWVDGPGDVPHMVWDFSKVPSLEDCKKTDEKKLPIVVPQ